jgi:glycosyltransferase involved in cell wall biosynthesis
MAMWEIDRYLRCEKPDIIHISSSKAGILGRLVGWMAGIDQIFYTAHGWVFNEKISGWKKWFYLWLEKIMALFTEKIFCVSKYDMDVALKYGFDGSKLKLIYNGVDVKGEKFQISNFKFQTNLKQIPNSKSQISNEMQNPSDKKPDSACHPRVESSARALRHRGSTTNDQNIIIGTVANFFGTKNLGLLAEIAEVLVKIDDKFRFVIVGDGPERKKVEDKIVQLKLEKYFELTGQLENFQDKLGNFDVFVLCSSKEGFPYILLEAGLAKVPIVASAVGGVSELIVDGETGLLCHELDKNLFARKIMDSIKNKQKSMMMAEKLCDNILKDFSLAKMQEGYEEEYRG